MVEPRSATPTGGVQVMVTVVGVPLPTRVTAAVRVPGLKSTTPDPGTGVPDHRRVGGVVAVRGVGPQRGAQRQVGGRRRLGARVHRPARCSPGREAGFVGGLRADGERGVAESSGSG